MSQASNSKFWLHLEQQLEQRRREGLARATTVSSPQCPTSILRQGRMLVNFGSNDYLGLSFHPDVVAAAWTTDSSAPDTDSAHLDAERFGSGASPLITGFTNAHDALVRAIAAFENTESAVVFSSGYAANVGTIASIATSEDVIFSDSLNHASIIDGCRLSRAKIFVYPHRDIGELRRLIQQHRHHGRFAFMASDSVFSMDGDTAPLIELQALGREYEMTVILDEAHATGVLGPRGRGLAEHLDAPEQDLIRIGTLSKAIGSIGGFVAGPRSLCDWIANHARSWIYSTSMPAACARAATCSIELIPSLASLRRELATKATQLRSDIASIGLETPDGISPIIPIVLGSVERTVAMSQKLADLGFYVPAIRPPTVPVDRSMLRVSLNAFHTTDQIDALLNAVDRSRS